VPIFSIGVEARLLHSVAIFQHYNEIDMLRKSVTSRRFRSGPESGIVLI
jgi:hypothetical protein